MWNTLGLGWFEHFAPGRINETGDLNHSKKVTELGQMIGQNGGSIINNTDGLDEINGLER